MGRTAALDVSVTSPLNPQTLLEVGVTATAAALTTEERKHEENDPKCSELGWVYIPIGMGHEVKKPRNCFPQLPQELPP